MANILYPVLANRASPSVLVAAGLVAAMLLQHLVGWAPCPLCIIQRLTSIALLLSLVVFARSRVGGRVRVATVVVAGAAALAGLTAAASHLFILYGPQTGACGPGVARFVGHLVDALPYSEWLLEGAGACEDTRYQLLGLPLPGWAGLLQLAGFSWAFALWKTQRGLAST